MPKYGLFQGPSQTPSQTVEGDYMLQNGEYVTIFRNSTKPSHADAQVAAFRLDKNQVVKEIEK
jgi:hypothetical protein